MRAVFRLVRDEIDKEAMLTAVMCGRDVMSTTYVVRHFGVSRKEVKVVVNEPMKTFSCSVELLETTRIPCSYLFVCDKG